MTNTIIIGASQGIGRALAETLSHQGHIVGLATRNIEATKAYADALPSPSYIEPLDITKHMSAPKSLKRLIDIMGGVDLIIINSGIGYKGDHSLARELNILNTNAVGFTAMARTAYEYFKARGKGHLVGISSIAALFGTGHAPTYNASKAYISNYMSGLRQHAKKNKLNITVLDVKPGFVQTDMIKNHPTFWTATPTKAASQIARAIMRKRSHLYVSKRWRLIAWALKASPEWLLNKLMPK